MAELLRPAAMRAIGFFLFWVLLSNRDSSGLAAGIVASGAATWASIRLLPAGGGRIRLFPLARFALRFLGQSVVAGVDVARRALDPQLPLRPGFVIYRTALPDGPARHAFTSLMSLLPGTVPLGTDATGGLVIHCLDVEQPVAEQCAAEERLFTRVIGDG
jgi:multicomponent Na+:H+ antiporter subunit E